MTNPFRSQIWQTFAQENGPDKIGHFCNKMADIASHQEPAKVLISVECGEPPTNKYALKAWQSNLMRYISKNCKGDGTERVCVRIISMPSSRRYLESILEPFFFSIHRVEWVLTVERGMAWITVYEV